ncbi:alanine dehydrogenase [Bacteroidota bacterium]
MRIGIPKETIREEKRVALAPSGIEALVNAGHSVFIETEAGLASHFSDEEYRDVGANIVYNAEEVYQRAELLAKVAPISKSEIELLQEGQIVFSFLHLAVAEKEMLESLLKKKITAISYELIEKSGQLPALWSMSEIAGQLAIQVGERYMESDFSAGRGMLMGGITGVAPAAVVIIGAGNVGLNCARAAYARGAQVIVLDRDITKLRKVEELVSKNITTVVANPLTIARGVKFADLLIGAVHLHMERSPHVVTEEMVKSMKKGAVIIDISIDQGGCIETSYPTSISDPVFVKHDVIHYCVPNIATLVSRTASFGLTNASVEFIQYIADNGLENSLMNNAGLANGVLTYNGHCSNEVIAETFNLEYRRLHIFSHN